jgi:hypothetical protein
MGLLKLNQPGSENQSNINNQAGRHRVHLFSKRSNEENLFFTNCSIALKQLNSEVAILI